MFCDDLNEKELQKQGIYACAWLIHFVVQQKLIQQCKAIISISISSVTQSSPTLCHPMDCSMPGLPVHHQLPEFTQTHVHSVGDAIQHISFSVTHFSSCLQPLPASGFFPMSQFFTSHGQSIGVSALVSFLPVDIQD